MEYSIINPALSLLMKHLVMGQRQKAPNFSVYHHTVVWFPLVSISLPRGYYNYRKGPKEAELPNRTEADLIIESDQAVRAVHSCNSWLDCGLR